METSMRDERETSSIGCLLYAPHWRLEAEPATLVCAPAGNPTMTS